MGGTDGATDSVLCKVPSGKWIRFENHHQALLELIAPYHIN
jgi:hypothetical protein